MQKKITKFIVLIAIIAIISICCVACKVNPVDNPKIEINSSGYWVINGEATNVKAQGVDGKDGKTPTISINSDGYWVINGETTAIKAQGIDGKDGVNGTNGNDGVDGVDGKDGSSINKVILDKNTDGEPILIFYEELLDGSMTEKCRINIKELNGKDGTDGVDGKDGVTPTISINSDGYWVINGETTAIKAQGVDGKDGINGTNGKDGSSINKVVLDRNTDGEPILVFYEELPDGTMTEKCRINIKELNGKDGADGVDGKDGVTPTISINSDGYWVINGETTSIKAQGVDGKDGINGTNGNDGADGLNGENGKNIFELYKELYGYEGTIDEWINDVLSGTLGTAEKRTVTFDYNGYTPLEGVPLSVKVVDGRTVILPNPDREGYDFLGWYVGNGVNDGQWLNTLVVSSDLTLIARWQEKEFEVRFETSAGELLKTEKVKYGNNATAPDAPHIEGCIFDSWDGELENITSNRVLHPVYLNIRYTITYVTESESVIPSETYLYNEIPTAPLNPTKSGYVFAGWKLENSESGELYAFDTPLTSDITLVAVWTDTIVINDIDGLKAIGNNLTANYSLGQNINLNGEEWTPLGEFKGIFDGKGYKIYNYVMNTATAQMGFFATNSGTIKNVVFSDILINNSYNDVSYTAIVAATNKGEISGVTVKESILEKIYSKTNANTNPISIGGISGTNNGTIKDSNVNISATINIKCHQDDDVHGYTTYVFYGGIVGKNQGVIQNIDCKTNLSYDSSVTGDYRKWIDVHNYIGGAVGENNGSVDLIKANITFNLIFYANNSFETDAKHFRRIGGVIGNNNGVLTSSSSIGTMTITNSGNKINIGDNDCGGVVGVNANTVYTCKSSIFMDFKSSVNIALGGILGRITSNSKTSDCIFDGEINSNNANGGVGGIVGNADGGVLSNCIMTGTIKGEKGEIIGCIAGYFNNGTIARCIVDGKVIASSGTPQYVSHQYTSSKIVTKCYRTENAILTVGETTTEGSQCEVVVLKPRGEIYIAEFFFENMLFNESIWGINPDGSGAYLKTLKE